MNKIKYIVLILSFFIFSSCESKKEENSLKKINNSSKVIEILSSNIYNNQEYSKYYLINFNILDGGVDSSFNIDSNHFYNLFYLKNKQNNYEVEYVLEDKHNIDGRVIFNFKPFFVEVKPKSYLKLMIKISDRSYLKFKNNYDIKGMLKFTIDSIFNKYNLPYYSNMNTFTIEFTPNDIISNTPQIIVNYDNVKKYEELVLFNERVTFTPQTQPQ